MAVPNEEHQLVRFPLQKRPGNPLVALEWDMEVHLVHFQPATFRKELRHAGFQVLELGVDDVETHPTPQTRLRRLFHQALNAASGWHFSTARPQAGLSRACQTAGLA